MTLYPHWSVQGPLLFRVCVCVCVCVCVYFLPLSLSPASIPLFPLPAMGNLPTVLNTHV